MLIASLAASDIISVMPSMGPASGGTVVDVVGSNFISTSYCRFGSTDGTSYTFVSGTLITCESPALSLGSYAVEVTNNDGYDFTSHNVQFMSRTLETVTSLLPTTGPAWGNTHVTVTGTGFVRGPELYCRFGTFPRVSATWYSDTRVVCASNVVATATTCALEVTSNNQDFSISGIVYEYVGMWTCNRRLRSDVNYRELYYFCAEHESWTSNWPHIGDCNWWGVSEHTASVLSIWYTGCARNFSDHQYNAMSESSTGYGIGFCGSDQQQSGLHY